jgi:hypothetical protein
MSQFIAGTAADIQFSLIGVCRRRASGQLSGPIEIQAKTA